MKLRSRSYGSALTAGSTAALLGSLKEFAPFPRLPLEIRMRIWQMAMKDIKRVVEIMVYSVEGYPRHYWTDTDLPALLFATKESRKYAGEIIKQDYSEEFIMNNYYDEFCGSLAMAGDRLEKYHHEVMDENEDSFAHTFACPQPREHSVDEGGIPYFQHYINHSSDIVYFNLNHNSVRKWLPWTGFYSHDDAVKRVAVSFDNRTFKDVDNMRAEDDCPLEELLSWRGLQEIILVFGDDCCSQDASQHRRIKEIATDGVAIPTDRLTHVNRFIRRLQNYWHNESEEGEEVEECPKVTIGRAVRE